MSSGEEWRAGTGAVCRLLLSKISAFKAPSYGGLLYRNDPFRLQSIWNLFYDKVS